MSNDNNTENHSQSINRRTVLKGMGMASAAGIVGVPTFAGSAAAETASLTIVSNTDTDVVGYRAGDNDCPLEELDEQADLTWVHPSWNENLSHDFDEDAQWIWRCDESSETGQAIDDEPTYYVLEPVVGDVVEFEEVFNVPGAVTSADLYITADNGYEFHIDEESGRPGHVEDGFECSDLSEDEVSGEAGTWDEVESYDITDAVSEGENTLTILGVNEQQSVEDDGGDGTVESNPGGLIFEVQIEYEDCVECDFGSVKYEFEDGTFTPEDDDDHLGYESFESKEDEEDEPIEVTFSNPDNYCLDDLTVTVKSGPQDGEVVPEANGDGFVVPNLDEFDGPDKAISYIEFECA